MSHLMSIPMDSGVLSGRLSSPTSAGPGSGIGMAIAHGAANDMDTPLVAAIAEGISAEGGHVLRFNFPYRDAGRKRPDPEPRLSEAWAAAMAELRRIGGKEVKRFIAAGKSLGARIASQMVAEGSLEADALVFYGYPLHAPGKKDRPRDAHLYRIGIPMLFFAGTRDPLCDLTVLDGVISTLKSDVGLVTVEGGDHSFKVPSSTGVSADAVCQTLVRETIAFVTQRCI